MRVRRGSLADVDALQPLWVAVHHQHVSSMPQLAPYVDDATTWGQRSALYRELLAKPDTVLLLADEDGRLVGYGLAHVMPAEETWVADTWVTGPRIGEIESLGVLPEHRGRGIGSRLLEELDEALREAGVTDVILGALAGNSAAIRLYERHGFAPTWLYLSRFARRGGPPAGAAVRPGRRGPLR
jgi:ribosomal protein S18 acetylase RimI-like enzyme